MSVTRIHPRCASRRGLTMVEAMMSSLIVAVLLVATMRLVGGAARSRNNLSERASGADIADGLIAEILTKSYADPNAPNSFGLDAGETSSSSSNYNDIDDYNGWTQTYAYTGRNISSDGIVATVIVTRATLATPSTDAVSETGLKHVKVTVKRQNRLLAQRDGWKANAP